MRRGFPATFLTVTGVLYLGLMTGVLVVVATLPLVVVLLGTDPAQTWLVVAVLAPLAGPACSAAFATFAAYGTDGTVVRTFARAWWASLRRSLAIGALASLVVTLATVDVAYLWGRPAGAVAIPPLVVLAVLAVVTAVTALVVAGERPAARLTDVLKAGLYVGARRWYLSAVTLAALAVLGSAVVKAPAVGLLVATGPVLYLVWANTRHAFSQVLRAADRSRGTVQEGTPA